MTKTFHDFRIELPHGASGEIDTLCPECSPTRKKKHARCLGVNVEKGTWICHHCGYAGGLLQGAQRRDDTHWRRPVYTRPAAKPIADDLDIAMVQWFATRSIPASVLRRNRISLQTVYMPQVEDRVRSICFPYYRGEEFVNAKYRDREKNFRMEAGAERILYGLNDIDPARCVVVEGECFPGDAEVLTRDGWRRLDAYAGQDVLQVSEDGGTFTQPSAVVCKEFSGDLVRHEVKGWVSVTTPEHNLVSVTWRSSHWRKFKAIDGPPSKADLIPRATVVDGAGIALSDDQIRLCVAVSADAAVREENYKSRYAVFGFKKSRKSDRLISLLDACGIEASITKIANGYDSICFHLPEWIPGRMFPWNWIADASAAQREALLDELTEWDGNHVPNRNQTEYSSKHEANAAWVQALCHTSGRCSSIIDRVNEYGEWFKTSLLHGKSTSSWQNVRTNSVPHNGAVYCLTVPSGMFLVRQERKVTVTGNCDKLSVEVAGITSCVSVPDGAPAINAKNYDSKFMFIDCEQVAGVKEWILAVDNDPPGTRLEEELARRFGIENCKRVTWPEGCKDANEVLTKHGAAALKSCIDNAKEFPISGVIYISQLKKEIELLYVEGESRGVSTGWPGFDRYYTVQPGEVTVITGTPGSGKSNWLDALLVNLAMNHDWIVPMFSPENQPLRKHASRLAEKFVREPFRAGPTKRMSPERRDDAIEWCSWYFPMILPDDEAEWTLENIFKIAQQLIRRHGIKGMVIDPWNELEHVRPAHLSESEYIGLSLKKVRQFARRTGLHIWIVAHPAKMYRTKDGAYPMPTLYDISGSANWFNKPDNGLVIYRDKNNPDAPVEVHTQKIRFRETGEVGQMNFKYSKVLADYQEFQINRDQWSPA